MNKMDPTQRLTETERLQNHKNTRPRDASTLLILDKAQGGPVRVLMGRRHRKHVFMPGVFVFPGGRVDPCDSHARFDGDYSDIVREKLMFEMKGPKTEARARAFGLAAIRETYEEAGVLIGKPTPASVSSHQAAGPWRAFADHDIIPDLSAIKYISRAITPPRRPRRFDTRFLVVFADAIAGRTPEGTGPSGELEEVDWVTLADASAMKLPTITKIVLEELEDRLATDPKLESDRPVPFYFWLGKGFRRIMI